MVSSSQKHRVTVVRKTLPNRIADGIANFSGSWLFIILHLAWFLSWFIFRLDVDILTLVVSLEAIFLASIILMVQHRTEEKDDMRDQADYEADIHSEQEISDVKRLIIELRDEIRHRRR